MPQPLVLAIEPDLRQAAILKRIVRDKALADVTVVDSRDAAIEAMRTSMPDVLLLSALLSPRDEDELMAHLRTLEHAGHLQTHTIPQLASALEPGEERASRGLLSAFRRKKTEPVASGCDPDLFAEEIRVFLQRAAEKKRELLNPNRVAPDMRPAAVEAGRPAAQPEAADDPPSSAWSSPFEWKPSTPASPAAGSRVPPSRAATPAAPSHIAEPEVRASRATEPVEPEPVSAAAVHVFTGPQSAPFESGRDDGEAIIAAPEPALPPPPPDPAPAEVFAANEAVALQEPAAPVAPAAAARAEPSSEAAPLAVDSFFVDSVITDFMVVEPEVEQREELEQPVEIERDVTDMLAAEPIPLASEGAVESSEDTDDQEPASSGVSLDEWAIGGEALDRLGPLARWARTEAPPPPARPAPVSADDVRALISSLAVPPAIASVSYPRGCRIRRVRVPAAPDFQSGDKVGAVIVSRRVLAEQREKRAST